MLVKLIKWTITVRFNCYDTIAFIISAILLIYHFGALVSALGTCSKQRSKLFCKATFFVGSRSERRNDNVEKRARKFYQPSSPIFIRLCPPTPPSPSFINHYVLYLTGRVTPHSSSCFSAFSFLTISTFRRSCFDAMDQLVFVSIFEIHFFASLTIGESCQLKFVIPLDRWRWAARKKNKKKLFG